MLTHIDLFAGIGGFSLAWKWCGGKTIQMVEIDPFCQKILRKNFPGVPIHDDIKTFNWFSPTPFILTGGFPCQPFSCAGKRRGKEDDRYLWPEMLRVVSEAKPHWIIGENVAGFIGLGLDDCISDLENQGYETQAFIIPACAVNAPHRRDRVWIQGNRCGSRRSKPEGQFGESEPKYANCHASYAECSKWRPHKERGRHFEQGKHGQREKASRPSECAAFADAHGVNGDHAGHGASEVSQLKEAEIFRGEPYTDTEFSRSEPRYENPRQSLAVNGRGGAWDEPWIEAATRLCRMDDGLSKELHKLETSDRVARLKALGNAIVPQVAFEIMKAIIEVERTGNDAKGS